MYDVNDLQECWKALGRQQMSRTAPAFCDRVVTNNSCWLNDERDSALSEVRATLSRHRYNDGERAFYALRAVQALPRFVVRAMRPKDLRPSLSVPWFASIRGPYPLHPRIAIWLESWIRSKDLGPDDELFPCRVCRLGDDSPASAIWREHRGMLSWFRGTQANPPQPGSADWNRRCQLLLALDLTPRSPVTPRGKSPCTLVRAEP